MLTQRILTAIALLPLVGALLFLTSLEIYSAGIAIICYLLGLEWAKLSGLKTSLGQTMFSVVISSINLLMWLFVGDYRFWPSLNWPLVMTWELTEIILYLALLGVMTSIFIVLGYSKARHWWANLLVRSVLGILFICGFFVSLICLRSINIASDLYYGGQIVLLMFCIIWAADTGAYFSGKLFGKHKLAPVVSPNKTWEGAIGGLVLSVIVALIGGDLIGLNISNLTSYCAVAIALAGVSVYGDLFESAMKRKEGIKDSGNLLPGHGGVLDRLDSSLVVAPVYFVIFSVMGWF